jgi:hypothetical protein
MIGREALQPLEPRHSLDKDTPSYYTKNESFAGGISKMWFVSSHFHHSWVFIGPWGASPTQRSWFGTKWSPAGQATWPAGRVERPPPSFSTALAFYSSCRHVSSKQWAKPT